MEEKFWDNLINENLPAIDLLIKNNYDFAALKLICCLIDSLSGLYSSDKKPSVRFNNFMQKYMPRFYDQVDFGDKIRLRKKDKKPLYHAGDVLYESFRNGSIHDGMLGLGVKIYRDKNYGVLWSGMGIDIIQINIIGFAEYLKKAVDDYKKDLESDEEIVINFKTKFNEIYQPVFKSKEEKNQNE